MPKKAQMAAPIKRTAQNERWTPGITFATSEPKWMCHWLKNPDINHPAVYPPIAQKATKPRSSRPA